MESGCGRQTCSAGRGGNRSGGAVCLLHHLCPLLRRCFVLDCLFRMPWRQPLWWGRVLASPPEPSASPLLRPRLFVSQAVEATALVGPCACFKTCLLLRHSYVLVLFHRPWRSWAWGSTNTYPVRMNFQTFARFIYERVLCLRCYLLQKPVLRGLCCGLPVRVCLCSYVNDGLALEAPLLLFFFSWEALKAPINAVPCFGRSSDFDSDFFLLFCNPHTNHAQSSIASDTDI